MISTGPFPPHTRQLAGRALADPTTRPLDDHRQGLPELFPPVRHRPQLGQPKDAAVLFNRSRREREVLRLLAYRYSDREIADLLSISYRTVTTHVANIFDKLGVNCRRDAAALIHLHDDL